jgi:hypothetical protein
MLAFYNFGKELAEEDAMDTVNALKVCAEGLSQIFFFVCPFLWSLITVGNDCNEVILRPQV